VSGKTKLKVNNTNSGPGLFNKEGIPVVFVNGNVKDNEFFLANPIDTGLFNYDLSSGRRVAASSSCGASLAPAPLPCRSSSPRARTSGHEGSDTWFDRTADLRVLLNGGGGAPLAYGPDAGQGAAPGAGNITPAVWARGSGNWLDREDSPSVNAFGRIYNHNLNHNLETVDFQMGLDLGKRGLLSDNDILVFGALGGFVHADLDPDANPRAFDYQGG
jgi:Autochaperone Domain Type 1